MDAVDPSSTESASAAAGYAVVSLISLVALVHTRLKLPPSLFATTTQISFALLLVATLAETIGLSLRAASEPEPYDNAFDLAYNTVFSLAATTTALAQIEYISTVVPLDEAAATRLSTQLKTTFIINGVVCFIGSGFRLFPQSYQPIVFLISAFSFFLIGLFDLLVNGYLVVFAFHRISETPTYLKCLLVSIWFLCLVFFAGSGVASIMFFNTGIASYITSIFLSTYPLASYLCLVTMRRILHEKYGSGRLAKEAIPSTHTPTMSAVSDSVGTITREELAVPVDAFRAPQNSMS